RVAQAHRADPRLVAADRSREQRAQIVGAHAVLLAEADEQPGLRTLGSGVRGLLGRRRGGLATALVLVVLVVLAALVLVATAIAALGASRARLFLGFGGLGSRRRFLARRLRVRPGLPELARLGGRLALLLALAAIGPLERGARDVVDLGCVRGLGL